MMDKDNNQMDGTFFGDSVEAFYEKLKPGVCYEVTGAQIKKSNKPYSKRDFCMSFDKNTKF